MTSVFDDTLVHVNAEQLATRLWKKDPAPFGGDRSAEVRAAVLNRLGWLDAPLGMTGRLPEIEAFAASAAENGLTDIYLLGMGGSSLCAEVLRDTSDPARHRARLVVLDTTDERAVTSATSGLDARKALFLVASKSGSTVEVTSLERHFRAVMSEALAGDPGAHFAAITDPGTALGAHAEAHHYRATFVNPPDIGGRYSALSLFGLVPAALLGLDVRALLASAQDMAARCTDDTPQNPGLQLGAFTGGHARAGRDKLTLLGPPSLTPLGVWIEQLVAESTGKEGHGVLPVVGETIGAPQDYGADRAFVALLLPGDTTVRRAADALDAAGHPVLRLETSADHLGAEFFRWEFGTAIAGAVLGVNPFDEPNVRGAKVHTQAQLDARASTGAFRIDPPLASHDGYALREHRGAAAPAGAGRYAALLDYLPADATRTASIERLRGIVRSTSRLATTHGIGPRYLHSTGQYHKGGPNTGTFLLITAADATATPIPETAYTFSVLKRAQALGDFDALVATGRSVTHVHFDDPNADVARILETVLHRLA